MMQDKIPHAMTNITEIIDQAAKKYCACGMDKGCVHKTAFTAGVEWATTDPEMMKAMLKPFAEWLGEKYTVVVLEESNIWRRYNSSEYFTTEELISKFITEKQKEDGIAS